MMAALIVFLWFLAGAAVEVVNAFSRKWTVERLGGRALYGWVAGGYILRLAMTSAVLVLAFRHRPISGAGALLGYVCSRWAAMFWMHRQLGSQGDTDVSPT
jgi:hypothetical protein